MASSNPTAPLNPISAVKPPPTVLQPGSGTVLTVGAGMEFAKLGDALKAAVNGDTIAVKAGTYTNDFGTVTAQVHIVAVGGVVNEVATTPPPNDKGILTVENDLSIQGFTFTGGSDGSPDGNVSGIRLENGSLNVAYCDFHDMQEGLLAGANASASVTIDHSEFAHNGTGDGLTHNIYVGAVASLTITNSYFHDAVVGHEIKSRAAVTTITNNIITDGPNGTASYDIDLPNGGVAKIAGNVIEKGANASNWYAIHYSGENQFVYANNSLDVTGNTILNDLPVGTGVAVLNHAATLGLTTSANLSGNNFYGFDPARLVMGAGSLSANTTLNTEPTYSQSSPWAVPPTVSLAAGPQLLTLINGGPTVTGGAARLTVNDTGGSNTIGGGAGGMTLAALASWDVISTAAGAADTINLVAAGEVLNSAGNDHINVTGNYETVVTTGLAAITGHTYSTYSLNGAGEGLTSDCSCVLNVGSAASAVATDNGGDIKLTVAAKGRLTIVDNAAAPHGGAAASATVVGGAGVTGWICNAGNIALAAGNGGASVQAGSGAVSITGGAGPDTLVAGSGNDVFVLGGGADQITFGSGSASVTGGTGADSYVFRAGAHGSDTITGFKQGTDSLHMVGFTGTGIASGAIVSGSTILTLSDGTTIDLAGVALPGYHGTPAPTGGGTPSPVSSNGTTQLTTSGQKIIGGTSLLSVSDLAGGNTVTGGAGGLSLDANTADLVTTAANASNRIGLFRYDTLTGAGSDQVTASANGNVITEAGRATVTLLGGGNIVQGGAGRLQVSDSVGGSTVVGGAGGLVGTLPGSYDQVTTAVNAADTVSLGGRDIMLSQGNDSISIAGQYNQLTATGAATISAGAGSGTYDLEGRDSLATAGAASVTVGQRACATVASAAGDAVSIVKLAGGVLAASVSLPGGMSTLDVAGSAATVSAAAGANAGLYGFATGGVCFTAGTGAATVTSAAAAGAAGDTITAGAGSLLANAAGTQGITVIAGSGNATLNGGAGNDVFVGGAGQAQLNLGHGADTLTLGAGSMTVQGGMADDFVVPGDAQGTLVIQNWTAQDTLSTPGLSHPVIAAQVVTGGSTWLTLMGGAHIELVGVTHFG